MCFLQLFINSLTWTVSRGDNLLYRWYSTCITVLCDFKYPCTDTVINLLYCCAVNFWVAASPQQWRYPRSPHIPVQDSTLQPCICSIELMIYNNTPAPHIPWVFYHKISEKQRPFIRSARRVGDPTLLQSNTGTVQDLINDLQHFGLSTV